jgi:hypothetical protein
MRQSAKQLTVVVGDGSLGWKRRLAAFKAYMNAELNN